MGVTRVLGRDRRGRQPAVWLVALLLVAVAATAPVQALVAGNGAVTPVVEGGESQDSANNSSRAGDLYLRSVGDVAVTGGDGTIYLWADGNHTAEVRLLLPARSEFDHYELCLVARSAEANGTEPLGCDRVGPAAGPPAAATLDWKRTTPGNQTLVVTLVGVLAGERERLAEHRTRVHVIRRTGDVDSDKLSNERELEVGTNLTDTDTDDDGLLDGAEVSEYGTNPLTADTDGDGARDAVEIQQGTDPTDPDTDGDGLSDKTEINGPTDPTVRDTDADGVSDRAEMELGTDPTTADTDGDGVADGFERSIGTDPTAVDTDGDLLDDGTERDLGTDPTATASPAGVVLLVGALLAVGTAWLVRRRGVVARLRSADVTAEAIGDDGVDATPAGRGDDGDEPLTDRDEVLSLLRGADGRLKQARIVEETGWSKAKVSRVLSRMEDDEDISKIRIGRENLICLRGREPDLARPSM